MAETTIQCPQCGVTVVTSKRGPEFRCPCCDATTIDLDGERTRKGQRGNLVRRRNLDLSRFTVEKRGTELFVRWNWNRGKGVLGLIILVVLLGFFGGGTLEFLNNVRAGGISFGDFTLTVPNLIDVVFAIGPPLIAVGLLHATLCCFFNRTEIVFGSNALRVWHGPIPCWPQSLIPAADLDRFTVHKKITGSGDNRDVSYELHAVRSDGRILRIIRNEDQATLPKAMDTLLTAHLNALRQPERSAVREALVDSVSSESTASSSRITLTCPNCAGALDPPPERAELRCRHCGADVPIPVEVQQQLGLDPPRNHDEDRMRDSFTVRDQGATLFVAADWDRGVPRFLFKIVGVLLAVGLLGTTLTWYFEWAPVMFVLSLIPLSGGMALGYIALGYSCNRTEVSVDSTSLRIWHGPLPWRQPRILSAQDLTQFLVRKNSYWSPSDESDLRWDLLAISHYGANQTVFSEMNDRAALETVEHLIEERLKIVDEAVRD